MDSQELSSDIILEILTRTSSLRTLDTCKTVNKEWQQLIYESSFMPTYLKRTNNVFGYFIQDIANNQDVFMFVSLNDRSDNVCMERLQNNLRILATCNQGIICCLKQIDYKNCRYYVCKPTTGQWHALPDPNTRYRTDAIAVTVLQSSPYLRCKIIRISYRRIFRYTNANYRCEIFDSKVWTWKEAKDVILPYEEFIISRNQAITASNNVYWLTNHDNVLAFNQSNNYIHKFPLPEPVHKNKSYECKQLLEYKGKLGLACLTEQRNMELWIAEDRRNKSKWTKKLAVNLENIYKIVMFPSPAGFCNEDIAFMKAYKQVVFYKLQDCSYNIVKLDGQMNAMECFQLRSDLESVKFRAPRIPSSKPQRSKHIAPKIYRKILK